MNEKSKKIKKEFGKAFEKRRYGLKLSRQAMALKLDISPRTIESWEIGRTFPNDMSIIHKIYAVYYINIPYILAYVIESYQE